MNFQQASPCQQIREDQSGYLDSLYSSCFEKVRKLVITNSGTEDDAYDIFQEAILVLYQNCQDEKFTLTCAPCTFLFSVAYNKWMRELEKRKKMIKKKSELVDEIVMYEDDARMQRERLVARCFSLLKEKCRQILGLSVIQGLPGKEVALQLEFSSYEYYRVAKQRCLDSMFKALEGDRDWNELKN